ncbi:uncharacterized protein METZ01_LOCUS176209, partial [marine metagenome]
VHTLQRGAHSAPQVIPLGQGHLVKGLGQGLARQMFHQDRLQVGVIHVTQNPGDRNALCREHLVEVDHLCQPGPVVDLRPSAITIHAQDEVGLTCLHDIHRVRGLGEQVDSVARRGWKAG